jgi:putative (di)nucleoside polyphosphate hydrolase
VDGRDKHGHDDRSRADAGALMDAAGTDLPYRLNVGVALFNTQGRVLIAKRLRDDGPEIILPGLEWQMPQGGVDRHEDPRAAAFRELHEETGIRSAEYLGETPAWATYDFPPYAGPPHRLATFRGQRQKWFALRFTGEDREIDVTREHANDAPPEFGEWRWEVLARVPALVVPFRRRIYEQVAAEFARFSA